MVTRKVPSFFGMKRRVVLFLCGIALMVFGQSGLTSASGNSGQERELPTPISQSKTPPPVQKGSSLAIEDIIRQCAAKESEFRAARANYTFRQEVRLQTLDFDDRPNGEFYRVSDILFTDEGKRIERIVRFPQSTLKELQITANDLRDIASTQPFSLTTEDLPKYNVTYVSKERLDEIDTYVFDVRPKVIPKYEPDGGGERVFQGRIWVDEQDLMIVKTFGKALPEGKERFPRFESYRENIDGKYWFPTYTYALDTLDFDKGPSVRLRMEVRYTNYKQFKTDIKILDDDEE